MVLQKQFQDRAGLMQQLELNDRRYRRKRRFTGPGSFEELTGGQLAAVLQVRANGMPPLHQAVELVQRLFGIPRRLLRRLTDLQLMQLATVTEFAFAQDVKMERWLVPVPKGKRLKAPGDTLDHLCFAQLMHADQCLDEHRKSAEMKHLIRLAAILFPAAASSFDASRLQHADLLAAKYFSPEILEAIRFNYVACRAKMAVYFPYLFPLPDPDEEPDAERKASNDNWLDVAIQLARKEQALGTLRQLEQENVYLVLRVLDRVIKEHQELEAEYAKMNR